MKAWSLSGLYYLDHVNVDSVDQIIELILENMHKHNENRGFSLYLVEDLSTKNLPL
jgi:hypothetical protein